MSKITLITGANKGIGFETARQLARKGHTILLGARDTKRGEEAARQLSEEGLKVQFVRIDPTDEQSIASAVEGVKQKFDVLDILINNAGTMFDGDSVPANEVSLETFRRTYDINVFGLHAVTQAFWPLLNASKSARLVNVSSALGSLALHANGTFDNFKVIAYDSSKAAVNMMTLHYAHLWKNTPHRANTIHPGSVKTELNPEGELSVEQGAKTSVDLATCDEKGPNGGFFHLGETLPW